VNKKPVVAISIVTVLLSGLCLCSVAAWQYFWQRCLWWECAPARNFRISELELPSSLFPPGAIVNHIYPLSDEFETVEDGSQSIYWDAGNGIAGYTIYRYPTSRRAKVGFELNQHVMFSGAEEVWPSIADSILPSTTADVVYIACGERVINHQYCEMVARYQEYVITFSADIDDRMPYADFENIVVYIDNQISSLLHP
jgi:hypothetical protein